MKESRTGFAQYVLQANKLPALFQAYPSSMADAIGVTRPSTPAKIVIYIESVVPELPNTNLLFAEASPASITRRIRKLLNQGGSVDIQAQLRGRARKVS